MTKTVFFRMSPCSIHGSSGNTAWWILVVRYSSLLRRYKNIGGAALDLGGGGCPEAWGEKRGWWRITHRVATNFDRREIYLDVWYNLKGEHSMKNVNSITLTKERRDDIVSEIKNFFSQERDEEIGDLAADLILDFIMEKIAPEIYNQGIYDSHRYMHDAVEDLLSIQK
jgi:uncharacterized protein (DUF2164 family)